MNQFAASKRRVDRLVRQAKDYPIGKLASRESGTLEDFADYLRRGKLRGALSLVKSFGKGVPSNLGRHHILNDEEALGWQEFEQSWYLSSLTQWMLGAETANDAPCLLAHAIVRGDVEMAGNLAELAQKRLPQKPVDWQGLGLPAFTLGLYARWTASGDFEGVEGVFGQVVASWSDEGLEAALNAVCEHHLDAAFDEESVTNEFLGYSSMPIELLAIRAVREREGLSMPALQHPFANTPLARMPFGPTGYDPTSDPWVERARLAGTQGGLLPADWQPRKPA